MIEALAIIGGGTTAVAVIALALAVRWGMSAKDGEIAAVKATSEVRETLAAKTTEGERVAFELKITKDANATLERLNEALSEELADAIEKSSLGAGLAAGDVHGRLLRIAKAHHAARARDSVPAEPTVEVSDEAASSGPASPGVPADDDAHM